jgi:hypothetical protein
VAADDSNDQRAFIFKVKGQAVQENRPTQKMVLRYNEMSNSPNNSITSKSPEYSAKQLRQPASNLALCGITRGNVRFIHLVITSHVKRSHTCKHFIIGSFKTLTLQHTSLMRTQSGRTHGRYGTITCACRIIIQNPESKMRSWTGGK